VPVNIAYIVE
jgi:hypothetical protein